MRSAFTSHVGAWHLSLHGANTWGPREGHTSTAERTASGPFAKPAKVNQPIHRIHQPTIATLALALRVLQVKGAKFQHAPAPAHGSGCGGGASMLCLETWHLGRLGQGMTRMGRKCYAASLDACERLAPFRCLKNHATSHPLCWLAPASCVG